MLAASYPVSMQWRPPAPCGLHNSQIAINSAVIAAAVALVPICIKLYTAACFILAIVNTIAPQGSVTAGASAAYHNAKWG